MVQVCTFEHRTATRETAAQVPGPGLGVCGSLVAAYAARTRAESSNPGSLSS